MLAYILRRLLLMIPTLFGIMLISFVVVQFAPGGPIERIIAQLQQGTDASATARISGGSGGDFSGQAQQTQASAAPADGTVSKYRGAQGLDPEFIKSLEKQFGFDKPAYERFGLMLWNYARFDFGKSYFRDIGVLQLIKEKLPVSMSLGIWMTLLTYLISIPLGIKKAVDDGSRFEGTLKDGSRDGPGAAIEPDGNRFEGTWRDSRYDGSGTCYIEFGHDNVARVDIVFAPGEAPPSTSSMSPRCRV